jgi:hypothetical protein
MANTTKTETDYYAAKHDAGKYNPLLLHRGLSLSVAELHGVLGFGAAKYGPDSWRSVPDGTERYLAAAMRHLEAHLSGQHLDNDSGRTHLIHAAVNLLFVHELTHGS